MSKPLVEITGFDELEQKLKRLSDDKSKKKEVLKILGQVANSTVKAVREEVPVGGEIKVRGKVYARKKRQVRNVVVESSYTAGMGKKSIGKKVMRKAKNPMLVVRARDITIGSKKKYGGFYLRQFVIRGTKFIKANPFMDRAYSRTKGLVTQDGVKKVENYMQKQINKLGL